MTPITYDVLEAMQQEGFDFNGAVQQAVASTPIHANFFIARPDETFGVASLTVLWSWRRSDIIQRPLAQQIIETNCNNWIAGAFPKSLPEDMQLDWGEQTYSVPLHHLRAVKYEAYMRGGIFDVQTCTPT